MNKIKKFSFAVVFSSLCLFATGAAFAQGSHPMDQANPGRTDQGQQMNNGQMSQTNQSADSMKDTSFAKKAAAGNLAEVKLGELAEQKSSNQTVKDFAKRTQADHSKANDQLEQVASRDDITLPTTIDKKDQETYDHLSKLSGIAFDRAYARDMVSDHEKDIAAFKMEANDGSNPSIKGFASETLPTLQEHLKLAQEMENSAGVAGS